MNFNLQKYFILFLFFIIFTNCSSTKYSNAQLEAMPYYKEMTEDDFFQISLDAFTTASIRFLQANLFSGAQPSTEAYQPYAYESLKDACQKLGYKVTDYQKKKIELDKINYQYKYTPVKWYPWRF